MPEVVSAPTSITVDTDKDTLLVGSPDGSLSEYSRTGLFLSPVLPAGLIDGIRSPVDRGLAFIPNPPRVYSSGGNTSTGLFLFSRAGRYQNALGLFGYQSFQGLYFEPSASGGVLYILQRYGGEIHAFTFSEQRDFWGRRFRYSLNLIYEEERQLSGIVYLNTKEVFLIALQDAKLLTVIPESISPSHGERVLCEVAERFDVRGLGIQVIDDLAFDSQTSSLYVVDSQQGKVFELKFTSSAPFHRGDTDSTGILNVSDAVGILEFLFLSTIHLECLAAADSNADRKVDIGDAVFLLQFLFNSGTEPPKPGPPGSPCGDAPLGLKCELYSAC